MDKHMHNTIQDKLQEDLHPLLLEFNVWLEMQRLNQQATKMKDQIQQKEFITLMKAEVIRQYKESPKIRTKLQPTQVSFREVIKEVKQRPEKLIKEPKANKVGRKKTKKRVSEDYDYQEKRAGRKPRRHQKAKLVSEDMGTLIFEFDNKTSYPVVLGRGKDDGRDSFIFLNKYTDAKSISHKHATIVYNKEEDRYVFGNEGRNGSVVDSSLIVKKDNKITLTDGSSLELGGYKMKFVYSH
ncbi:FHA domain-containing protein [Entamoeba marina]